MPVRSPTTDVQVTLHTSAFEALATLEPHVLPTREREANTWLPQARKLRKKELEQAASGSSSRLPSEFWLSVWSTSARAKTLDLVLACTSNHLGEYPIFLHSQLPASQLTSAFLSTRIPPLVDRLYELVPSSRVFSVFAPSVLTMAFVSAWSKRTGVMPELDPFYAAKFTTCTRKTVTPPKVPPIPEGDTIRMAEPGDADRAAVLCKEFADDSVYFPLSLSKALKEAKEMIRNRQLWVYYTTLPDGRRELASIVACTRVSDDVATISKVYTNPMCRSRGCAERLVRKVCEYWLYEEGKASVVLYVAHDNAAAEKVYHRVGFEGLSGRTAEGVEDWLEIGFAGTQRGHW